MKKLTGLANNLCAMVVSEGASDLYEELMDLSDGLVTIDLLTATGFLNCSTQLTTPYLKEISNWFVTHLSECGVKLNELSIASISIHIDSSSVPCDRSKIVHYLAKAATKIQGKGKCYEKAAPATHVWHKRSPNYALEKDGQHGGGFR